MIFEVQKHGVTVEWTDSFTEAESAFKSASNGEVVLYQLVGSNKVAMRRK